MGSGEEDNSDLDHAFKKKLNFNDDVEDDKDKTWKVQPVGDKHLNEAAINHKRIFYFASRYYKPKYQSSRNVLWQVKKKAILRKPKLKIVKFRSYDECKYDNSCKNCKINRAKWGNTVNKGSTSKIPCVCASCNKNKKNKPSKFDKVSTSCSQEVRSTTIKDDISINELAAYFDNMVHIPKKMSSMAEMMYT